jgi:hypothetical protein
VLVWDLAGAGGPAAKATLTDAEATSLWNDLGSGDAEKAHAAIWSLTAAPVDAVKMLQRRVKAARAQSLEGAPRLIAELDSDDFEVRQAAAAALKRLGRWATPLLRKALASKPSQNTRLHLKRLIAAAESGRYSAEELRQARAVEVLERTATADARKLLAGLARGDAEEPLTREAAAALRRLEARQATASPR